MRGWSSGTSRGRLAVFTVGGEISKEADVFSN